MITSVQQSPHSPFIADLRSTKTLDSNIKKSLPSEQDVVNIHSPALMSDEDAAIAVQQIGNSLQENSSGGLSIHDGLDMSRVLSLLED